MEFLKWTLKESPFHYGMLLLMTIMTFFWEDDVDKTLARIALAVIGTVLVVGKYLYWKKMKDAGYM